MSSKRHGGKIVSDLSRAILFVVKHAGNITLDGIVAILGNDYDTSAIRKHAYSLKYHNSLGGSSRENLRITSKGLAALENLEFKTLTQTKSWDGKWRIVIYDIPEAKRQARNRVRQLLKDLGFHQLQISAWAHPLPCLKQFHTISKAYGVEKHLLLLEVNHSKEFSSLHKTFAKQYSSLKKPR